MSYNAETKTFEGDLELMSYTEEDLYFLNEVEVINGNLDLNDLNGEEFRCKGVYDYENYIFTLNNLKRIEGDFLNIESVIVSFDFPNLEYIGGKLEIESSFFYKLEGFSKLREVSGDFICDDNIEVEEYKGFESLEKVGGNFSVGCGIVAYDINKEFFKKLKVVEGDLEIVTAFEDEEEEEYEELLNSDGLASIEKVCGEIKNNSEKWFKSLQNIM